MLSFFDMKICIDFSTLTKIICYPYSKKSTRRMLWIIVDGEVDKGCLMIRMGVSE